MKRPARLPKPARRRLAFTLMELLVVMAVIGVLASLTLAGMGYATKKALRDRAYAEIRSLSLAIEDYKIDNGDYPREAGSTDTLNPRTSLNATATAYARSSLYLYKQLSGDDNADRSLSSKEREDNKVYFTFPPSMLSPKMAPGAETTTPVTSIADPFASTYGYSTIGSRHLAEGQTRPDNEGYNPTFDLWSTVDSEKTGTTPESTWITNWHSR